MVKSSSFIQVSVNPRKSRSLLINSDLMVGVLLTADGQFRRPPFMICLHLLVSCVLTHIIVLFHLPIVL